MWLFYELYVIYDPFKVIKLVCIEDWCVGVNVNAEFMFAEEHSAVPIHIQGFSIYHSNLDVCRMNFMSKQVIHHLIIEELYK